MKKYLSSYKIWNEWEKYKKLFWKQKDILYIANALDMVQDLKWKANHEKEDIGSLEDLWFVVEWLDLREYFWKKSELEKKLANYWGVFVSGGNVFVLNQSFKLSWFWKIIQAYDENNPEFVYAGYSAWVCVLSPSLDWYDIVDDAKMFPYKELQEQVWRGLWVINFNFSPHYDSDHPESDLIDKEIKYCIQNKILFKAVRDWEVLIIE